MGGILGCDACTDRKSDHLLEPVDAESPPRLRPASFDRGRSMTVGSLADSGYVTKFPPLIEAAMPTRPQIIIFILPIGFCLLLCEPHVQDFLASIGLPWYKLAAYMSIPVVSVLFTYVHIWLALWLTFYPIKFLGCLQIPDTNVGCGWQGIMPSKAEKMARTSCRLMTEKLIKVDEVLARIDTGEINRLLAPVLKETLMTTIQAVAMEEEPDLWNSLPASVKDKIVARANADAPAVISNLVKDIQTNIKDLFDLEELVVTVFTEEPELLNHMFISCGYSELKFIRDCGAYMGGAFGIVQVIIWIFYSAGWMLPAFGFFAGILSNFLALKMIFEPVEPVDVFGYPVQGLFLKRQTEVSEVYAKIVAENVLFAKNVLRAILTGRLSAELFDVLHKHVAESTDKFVGSSPKMAIQMFRDKDKIKRSKYKAAETILRNLPNTTKYVEKYLNKAMDLESLLCERLQSLKPSEFENLLHPVFQEDEWKLILMGGVLGIGIGCMQWHFLGS